MNIYDCFLYNNEDEILDLRLNILNNKVNFFIIVESEYTHTGKKKKLAFNKDKFKEFSDKIIYLQCKTYINGVDKNKTAWKNENLQRDYISTGFKNIDKEDYIIISDIDEIPNLDSLNQDDLQRKIISFKQRSFIYKYNICEKYPTWLGSKMCKLKYLKSPQWLRNLKVTKKYKNFRIDKIFFSKSYEHDYTIIENGGWHFSWIGSLDYIKSKIKDTAHTEINLSEFNCEENLKNMIQNMLPIKPDGINYITTKNFDLLPNYLIKNIEKYRHNFN